METIPVVLVIGAQLLVAMTRALPSSPAYRH